MDIFGSKKGEHYSCLDLLTEDGEKVAHYPWMLLALMCKLGIDSFFLEVRSLSVRYRYLKAQRAHISWEIQRSWEGNLLARWSLV